ncbi:hypothetical protein H310_15331, partial [Aphanomyces invadans]
MPTKPTPSTDLDRAIAYVKRQRSRFVTTPEILDMIVLNATLRQDGTPAASRTAAHLLHRKTQL